ncbi:hypothetical protein COL21_13350 [Bacillus thuringiensis]|uniref:alpha-amylase family glycosyl hydrolase n=1 Tax=Bacillus thuringiensis TaxID=1428 RepID=UPI000BF62CF4|nr:alpha-amylase family glycosyl hydrolase [Bacillus thuringiensis]PFV97042.1 hypothetical protein COL21_13350 [Bacillus thuringiensis]PGR99451.1 hypothetical protein COC68_08175 [Bacillus thuringiensis]
MDVLKVDSEIQKVFEKQISEIKECYMSLYGENPENFKELLIIIYKAYSERSAELKLKDLRKTKKWYMSEEMVGISLYVDLFSENLEGMKNKIKYLKELGVNYIHFLPILKTREGNDDGGFAISSYTEINPKYGSMTCFEELLDLLRKENIISCIDFVLNHTAEEHEWALKAKAGLKKYQDMYIMYDTKEIPDEFEKTLPLIFPEESQTNFIYCNEINKWVCSIFYEYQWDLNYRNPALFNNIVQNMLFLLNKGVDILRLDAIPHIWKELGTDSFNRPEVHEIIKMLKLIVNIVAPGSVFKGETIGPANDIMMYFGDDQRGCQLMYNFPLMVSLWNSLASEDTREMRITLDNISKHNKDRCWINYVRGHDDIGWHIEEDICENLHIEHGPHVDFLVDFYSGKFERSFARGESKGYVEKGEQATTSGTSASLCGIEKAMEENNEIEIQLACKRLLLLYNVILSYEGIPVIFSGDELGITNNYSYKEEPSKSSDSRWLHRPKMNWEKAENRCDENKVEGFIFQNMKKLISIRKKNPIFNSYIQAEFFDTLNIRVLGFYKKTGFNRLLLLSNFSDKRQKVNKEVFQVIGFNSKMFDLFQEKEFNLEEDIVLKPYEFFWLFNSQ